MANSSILLEIVLEDDEILSAYLDDIRDMYYVFEVSDERSCRNTFAREVFGSDVGGLRVFPASASDSSRLVASLRTMAMGDTNACEIAQEAHLALAYEAGIIRPDSFLSPAALAPRGPVSTGIIIDDCLTVCKEKAPVGLDGRRHPLRNQPVVTACQDSVRRLHAYVKHRLTRHDQKAIWRKYSVVAWGVSVNGKLGTVNSPFGRILFLAGITAEVASLGYSSVELLMSLVGSWISAMLCRRRTLCLLELVYEALRGRELDDVLRLSGRLRSELLSLVLLAPLLQANLRAAPDDRLWLVDASSQKLAVVSTPIPPSLSKELGRFALRKGTWSRMLPPPCSGHEVMGSSPKMMNCLSGPILT
jgi:hypothetical protein